VGFVFWMWCEPGSNRRHKDLPLVLSMYPFI